MVESVEAVFDYKEKLYDIGLFEHINVRDIETGHHLRVTRMPGCWLVENMQFGSMCFVPYNDEFNPKLGVSLTFF